MVKLFKTTLTAAVAVAVLAGAAVAGPRDVVRDERMNIIVNTFGNCVRTKWENSHDNCIDVGIEARTVYFNFDSAAITPAGRAKLDSLISVINGASNIESVHIVGYADIIGDSGYNQRLSQRRADAVKRYLSRAGGVQASGTEVRAFGDTVPVSDCPDLKGKALQDCLWRDRRVEVEFNVVR